MSYLVCYANVLLGCYCRARALRVRAVCTRCYLIICVPGGPEEFVLWFVSVYKTLDFWLGVLHLLDHVGCLGVLRVGGCYASSCA